MEQMQKNEQEIVQEAAENAALETETVQVKEEQTEKQSGGSLFEGIYDRLPDISVRSVDRFIILCVIAFIAVILIGILKANHVF